MMKIFEPPKKKNKYSIKKTNKVKEVRQIKIKKERDEMIYQESIDLASDMPTIKTEVTEPDINDAKVAIKTENYYSNIV